MVKAVETRIYRLHHDPQTSERVGYLVSQQRLALQDVAKAGYPQQNAGPGPAPVSTAS